MSYLEAIFLGIIQGFTEFLPISSSGHLVIAQHFMSIHQKGVLLEIVLHMGTLVAILIYYWDDLIELIKNTFSENTAMQVYLSYLVVATIPIICIGLISNNFIESMFSPSYVFIFLLINGFILASTYFSLNRSIKQFTLFIACIIGLFQIFALLPGISRSGITISTAMLLGIKHDQATKFSFFLAIPVLLGAGIFQLFNVESFREIEILPLIIGFLFAAITGYYVINWLVSVITNGKFYLFSIYCVSISILSYILII